MIVRPAMCALAVSAALLLLFAAPAAAYSVTTDTAYSGEVLGIGDTVGVDVFLDTEGVSGTAILGIGVLWDPNVMALRDDLSSITDQLLLTPGAGPGDPDRFLELARPTDPFGRWPAPPPGLEQINLDYVSNGLLLLEGTDASAADELVASLVFEVVGLGETDIVTTVTAPGNVVALIEGGQTVILPDGAVRESDPIRVRAGNPVPEPSAALLFAIGAVLTGAHVRRPRQGAEPPRQ